MVILDSCGENSVVGGVEIWKFVVNSVKCFINSLECPFFQKRSFASLFFLLGIVILEAVAYSKLNLLL